MAKARAPGGGRNTRLQRWSVLAYAIGGLSLGAVLAAFILQTVDGGQPNGRYNVNVFDALLPITFAVTGMLIGSRRPSNPIGWLFLFSAAWSALGTASTGYLRHALIAEGATWTPPDALQSLAVWGWVPLVIPVVAFVPMFFPNGRLLSARWRLMPAVALVGAVGIAVAVGLSPTDPRSSSDPSTPYAVDGSNPYALDAPWVKPLLLVSFALLLLAIILAIASLVLRMRRGSQIERQQLKAFFYAAILWPLTVVPAGVTGSAELELLALLGIVAVPVAVTVAILRYRLYDIDVLIRRTLIYAMLSAALLVAYLSGIALVQFALAPVTSGNGLAVAISTLTVVALFQPLHRRIQTIVDRRFYRRRYDTERTLDSFAVSLRDEIELDSLEVELIDVVRNALQPAEVSLWLRDGHRPSPGMGA